MQRTRYIRRGHSNAEICRLSFVACRRKIVGIKIAGFFPLFINLFLVIFGVVGFVELVHYLLRLAYFNLGVS